ncbi:MAG: class I SAM-dependent methyltransferase [Candidatus Omnitrophota bacterium]|nr:class I SAM-dependent methyltransferase [Candidatus Omnitrophota bacterium]
MRKANIKLKLIHKTQGYWQYYPLPLEKDLQRYYAKKYFQLGKGSYATTYTEEEKRYFRLKANLIFRQIRRFKTGGHLNTFLDVGCGEGWLLNRMYQAGMKVKGLDFSDFGLMKFHRHLKSSFVKGNVFSLLEAEQKSKQKYNIVALANVIEHVVDPKKMIYLLKKILSRNGILIIIAPNDFSYLHKHLLKEQYISKKFWLAYPDHISYFNKDSMEKFLIKGGFKVETVVADNPIDLNLMNSNTNYINDRSKGKETHYFRVRTDNFLASISEDKLLDLYTILGSMGVGRDLNYYCSLKT